MGLIKAEASEDANVIFGVAFDPDFDDKMKVTVIATGFNKDGIVNAKDSETVAKTQIEAAAATVAKPVGEMPVVEPSNVTDDDFSVVAEIFNKNRRNNNGF